MAVGDHHRRGRGRSRLRRLGAYRCRFGSLLRAYTLVGYTPDRDFRYVEINRRLRELHPRIVAEVVAAMQRLGGTIRRDPKTELVTVNDEFTVSLVIARCLTTQAGHSRWTIRLDTGLYPDLTVAVRMAEGNDDVLDYYLLPAIDIAVGKLAAARRPPRRLGRRAPTSPAGWSPGASSSLNEIRL